MRKYFKLILLETVRNLQHQLVSTNYWPRDIQSNALATKLYPEVHNCISELFTPVFFKT